MHRNSQFLRVGIVTSLIGSLLLSLFVYPTHATELAVNGTIDITGLEDLGPGWTYEGWLIENGAPVSTGTFTVDGSGNLSDDTFSVAANIADVSTFVLTIEPDPDPDPAPADTHILAGDFAGGFANIDAGHPAALGDDFSTAAGDYILAVPSSDGMDGADYYNGIWFLDPAGGPGSSLDLPTLPAGWAYEGWAVVGGVPMTTGTFTDVAAADSDGGGPYAGPNATPPFPGQDYINPLTDLRGGAAVISIEPDPDNSPAPFTFKPLVDGTIDDVGGGTLQAMGNNAAGFPTGTVVIGQSVDVSLSCTGLEDLGSDFAYEGWLIDNGAPVTTGTFTVDGSGNLSQTDFMALVSDMNNVSTFVLTIEPDPDPDPAPADTHILAGDFVGGITNADVAHPAALGDDFTTAAGDYILAVPSSDGMDGADYYNGIWFLDPAGGPGPSLSLPILPAGWVYEGWAVVGGVPMTTGTFTDVAAADSDGGGPYAGPNPTPPFPGQDYINPLTDLRGGAAVISIEPYPDNSPAPFTLKPLVDGTIDDVGGGVLQAMGNNASGFPTCMVEMTDGEPSAVTLSTGQIDAGTFAGVFLSAFVILLGMSLVITRKQQ